MDITISKLKSLIPNIRIIDIRDNYMYNIGNIPTSKNIPYQFLIANPEVYLNHENVYYIYCEYGNTSKKACEILSKKGYKVVNVLGGYNEYRRI